MMKNIILHFLFILENELSTGKKSKKTTYSMFYGFDSYDAPNVIICSMDEFTAKTSSNELQAYKSIGVSCSNDALAFMFILCIFSFKHSIVKTFCMIQLLRVF